MADSRTKSLSNACVGHRKRSTALHDDLNALSKSGIQKAKECIDFLKFSEGLVRRDIDLVRMQLEIKLKKLESRLQAELRNVVEKETSVLEKFIDDVKDLEDTSLNEEDERDKIRELESIAAGMERKRLKLEVNKSLELSLEDIRSFGNIKVHKINDSEPVTGKRNKVTDKPPLPNGLRRLSLDSGFSESKPTLAEQCHSAKPTQKNSGRLSSTSSDRDCDYRKRGAEKMSERFSDFDQGANVTSNGDEFQRKNEPRPVEQVKEERVNTQEHVRRLKDTVNSSPLENVVFANQNLVGIKHIHDNKISGPVNATKDDTDWAKADPFSILRALKEQTSRTEENLKALRVSNNSPAENKKAPKAESDPARQTQVKQPVIDSNKRIPNTGRTINALGSEQANLRGSHRQRSSSAKTPKVTGCQDTDKDRFEHMDKVTRANELWFGRDRQRRSGDDLKRRARSLSPKTVRFRMEEGEPVCNDKAVDPQTNPWYNDTDNSHRALKPFVTDISSKECDNNGMIHASDANETQLKIMRDDEISECSVYTGTGDRIDELSTHNQSKYKGRCEYRQNDSHSDLNKDFSKIHNSISLDNNPLYHKRKHKIDHISDNLSSKCQDKENDSVNDFKNENRSNNAQTNFSSAKDQQTNGIGDDARIQRLRNKRIRSRSIGGITNNIHNRIRIPSSNPDSISSFRNDNSSNQTRQLYTERVQNSSGMVDSVVQFENKSSDIVTDLRNGHQTLDSRQTNGTDETGRLQRLGDRRSRNRNSGGLTDNSDFSNNYCSNKSSHMHRERDHTNHKPNAIGNYLNNGNQTLESLQETSTDDNERKLRLRNKRSRNKTIGGLTDYVHTHIGIAPGPFPNLSDTNSSHLSRPLHTTYDHMLSGNLGSGGNSCMHDSNSSDHLTSSNQIIREPSYEPRRRIYSDNSTRLSHSMQPEDNTTNDNNTSQTIFANALSYAMDSEPERSALNNPMSSTVKVKQDKQRIPSCREMLFLD